MKPIYVNRECGGENSTAAVIHHDGHMTALQMRDFANRLALEASQRTNGGIIYWSSRRPCSEIPTVLASATFIASMNSRGYQK